MFTDMTPDLTLQSKSNKPAMKNILKKTWIVMRIIFNPRNIFRAGRFLGHIMRWLNISYKTAMWSFGILTLLLSLSLYSSIYALITLEAIFFPILGITIKGFLWLSVVSGWMSFWVWLKPYRKGPQIATKTHGIAEKLFGLQDNSFENIIPENKPEPQKTPLPKMKPSKKHFN